MSFLHSLHTFPAVDDGPRPGVLVLPGGGYHGLADHGGSDDARWLQGCGLPAFVLEHPVAPHRHRGPLAAATGARAAVSLERLVDRQVPPTFVWSTADDEAVPVGNTLRYSKALTEHGVATELHVLPHGSHGLGLAPEEPAVAGWSRLCEEWLHRGGWTGPRAGLPA